MAGSANLDNVHVVPRAWLGERIGEIGGARRVEVKRSLGFALDWGELMAL